MTSPYFLPEDFRSLRRKTARTDDPKVLGPRKQAVVRLRDLHVHHLGPWMRRMDLHPHPNRDYWTNVFFPKFEANGEWVDYLRLGYGLEGRYVKQMAEKAQFTSEIRPYGGTTDHMAFHYVAQIQVGLTSDYWWINFYVDDKAWLEMVNLLEKVKAPARNAQLLHLLADLQNQGFELRLWSTDEPDVPDHARATPAEFLADLTEYRRRKFSFNVDLEKRFLPDAPENDTNRIAGVVQQGFEALIPLYRFWAWHPERNSFVPGLT